MTTQFDFDDRINLRDVTARVEELREERKARNGDDWEDETENGDNPWATENPEDDVELVELENLLSELAGYGGDYQWEGDWYPQRLIRNSYFTDAMQELVEDIGDIPRGLPGYLVIDWEATADNLRMDYSSVDFAGTTFWYR